MPLSTKNCRDVFLWRWFAAMQFARVWRNYVATLLTNTFIFMFQIKAKSPWVTKKVLTDGAKNCWLPWYGNTKLQWTFNVKIIVVFHANIRTMRRRQNAFRFHEWSSIIILKSRMKWGLKNLMKCHHIPFSVVDVRLGCKPRCNRPCKDRILSLTNGRQAPVARKMVNS